MLGKEPRAEMESSVTGAEVKSLVLVSSAGPGPVIAPTDSAV